MHIWGDLLSWLVMFFFCLLCIQNTACALGLQQGEPTTMKSLQLLFPVVLFGTFFDSGLLLHVFVACHDARHAGAIIIFGACRASDFALAASPLDLK